MKALKKLYNTLLSQNFKKKSLVKGFFDEKEWALIQEANYIEKQGFDILKDDEAGDK